MKTINIWICLQFLLPTFCSAQQQSYKWSCTLLAGITEYNGTLGNGFFQFAIFPKSFRNSEGQLVQRNFPGCSGLELTRNLKDNWGISLQILHGEWGYYSKDFNRYFFRWFNLIDLNSLWYPFSNKNLISPFIQLGAGYRNIHVPPERYAVIHSLHFSLGAGFSFSLSERTRIQFRSVYGFTNNDMGDGIRNTSESGSDRFLIHQLGLNYSFCNQRIAQYKRQLSCPGF